MLPFSHWPVIVPPAGWLLQNTFWEQNVANHAYVTVRGQRRHGTLLTLPYYSATSRPQADLAETHARKSTASSSYLPLIEPPATFVKHMDMALRASRLFIRLIYCVDCVQHNVLIINIFDNPRNTEML